MIEDFLTWLQLISQAVINQKILTAKSQSSLLFIAYLLTIRKSYLFGMAFLVCEVVSKINLIPIELTQSQFGLVFYCEILLTWIIISSLHITRTTNKDTLTACVIMILFLLIMAMDSYINAHTETFIWRNYENIILCIHVCIILSLYQPRAIIDIMVGKLHDFIGMLRNNYACSYFWYTVKNRQTKK